MRTMFPSLSAAPILAHQGGWDEVALIGGPIVVIAILLIVAKKRVDNMESTNEDATKR